MVSKLSLLSDPFVNVTKVMDSSERNAQTQNFQAISAYPMYLRKFQKLQRQWPLFKYSCYKN